MRVDTITKTIFFCALFVFVAIGTYDFYLDGLYVDFPKSADANDGRIIPRHWKSTTIYVTSEENLRQDAVDALLCADLIILGTTILARKLLLKKLP